MNFRVIWTRQALDQLTNIWLAASDRAGVTVASRRIDQVLARDPLGQGESRSETNRLMFEPPLAVYYRTDVAARVVQVISVGPAARP